MAAWHPFAIRIIIGVTSAAIIVGASAYCTWYRDLRVNTGSQVLGAIAQFKKTR
jgi:uncharacterized protein (DUF2062 family)